MIIDEVIKCRGRAPQLHTSLRQTQLLIVGSGLTRVVEEEGGMLSYSARRGWSYRRRWELGLRSVFSFKFEGVPFKNNDVKDIDVDRMVESSAEGEGLRLHKRGHISSHVMKTDDQPRRRRKKNKLSPREKYMFKKMAEKRRSRPSPNDPASELTPLYEMTSPWWEFSPVKEKIDQLESDRKYSKDEQIAIASIRRTIKESQPQSSATPEKVPEESKPMRQAPSSEIFAERVSLNYYRSAENIAISPEEVEPKWNEALAERLARRLHMNDTKVRKPLASGSGNEIQECTALEKALARDPTFQHDALKLEAESKDLEDVDQWIGRLREFATHHEKVLDAMDPNSEAIETDTRSGTSPGGLGASGEALKMQMVDSGINVAALEKQAQKELERELTGTKTKAPPPADAT